MNKVQKLVYLSLLCAIALVIFIIELQIPPIAPIPGLKLGLANMVSLAVLILYGPKEALTVLLLRIFLGTMITGKVSTIFFSLAGGLLSNIGMILLYKYCSKYISIWVISVVGSILHIIGQLVIAVIITNTPGIFFYAPILLVSSIVAGYFVGWGALFISKHLKKIMRTANKDF
ncbi:Gx transporter family protein [Niameybacter massiliensis]|uniref:Gx transporter family protein n=1 Tax=Holtiella tumoricola TaxID=3018743 RepID=A0AA42DPS4_9FIRM|nr:MULTISPECIES: Gx transporter family protein [Lachnospirales]MDA3732910.1 Gx transporter family protein [Holtiella tumoricola]